MGKHKQKAAKWRRLIERFKASGLSQSEFCRKAGVRAPSLRYWRVRLDPVAAPSRKGTSRKFVQVVEEAARPRTVFRIVIPDGTVIEATDDLAAAARLASMLREASR